MIYGEKIILREFRETDLDRIHKWTTNNDITKNFSFTTFPQTLNKSKQFLDSQLERSGDTYINFVIAKAQDEEQMYIGSAGLKNIDFIHRKAEFNIVIADTNYMGKGHGTEATKLIFEYAFNTLNLNKVYLSYIEFNKAAQRAYEKAGFKYVATFKEDIFYEGKYYDQIYMEILKKDYTLQVGSRDKDGVK